MRQTTPLDSVVPSKPTRRRVALLTLALTTVLVADLAARGPRTVAAGALSGAVNENPLRKADPKERATALTAAWTTFQSSCRPCHGSLGAGDGPHAYAFPKRSADLRRPSREVAPDAVRFARIRDGAAVLPERPWESNMPAFGDELDASAIWGLVALLEDFGKEGSGLDAESSGTDIYAARCAACHGASGAGDGPLAAELLPPPRNFVHGAYRLRSTEFGEAPLDSDIIGSTAHGLGVTGMGRFLSLGVQRLEDVAATVMSFNPKLFAGTPKTLTGSPTPAQSIDQLAARGRAVYEEAKCAECHGATGRGDGPSASTLKDDEGHPSVATNLTQRWTFKIGSSANDVFRTLASGLNGTSMKSYSNLPPDDRWALAYYLDRIGRGRPRAATSIPAAVVTDEIPLDPAHPFWKAALRTEVPMAPQIEIAPHWTDPAISVVEVVAAVNKDQLGMMLTWDDRSPDLRNDETRAASVAAALARHGAWKLPDAIAVEFPKEIDSKGALPPSLLGDEKRPVRRWYWSAERQERGEAEAIVQLVAGPRATPVTSTDSGPVRTAAAHANGQWRVVMVAKRPGAVTSLPVSIQAWDGGAGESGTWFGYSAWMTLNLQ
ncbi:MAG: c-type cytochrome [Deltaproteobacteria bacterium]|nr:c-type cytochrome [Deltaproteobacteria bacterium]